LRSLIRRSDGANAFATGSLPLRICLLLFWAAPAACAGGPSAGEVWADRTWTGLSLQSQVEQLIVADLHEMTERSSEPVATRATGRPGQSVRNSVGGVLLRGGEADAVARLLSQLQREPGVPLLVVAPLDRGLGGVVEGATEFPKLAHVAGSLDAGALRDAGRVAGGEAHALGIHLALVHLGEPAEGIPAPLDQVQAGTTAYLQGLRDAGRLVTVSVFPEAPSADALRVPLLTWDRAWLEARELPLLREAVRSGVAGMLLEPVALPAISGDTLPIVFSRAVTQAMLRRDLGFDGLVMADLSGNGLLARSFGEAEAAVRALAGGADLLLGVTDVPATLETVLAAIENGRIPRAHIAQASRRVLRAKAAAGLHRNNTAPQRQLRSGGALELARRLREQSDTLLHPPSALPDSLRRPAARTLRQGPAAEAGMSEAGLARADAILRRAVADSLFPGAALAVGRRGVLVRLRGYGQASREPGAATVEPEHTLYDLASLTKVLGPTTAAMALVEDGTIELDAPVSRYLAAFSSGDRERVTVRQLLSHTGGLPAGLALHATAASPQDALRQIVGARLVLDPGAVALYSDISMIVLGEALAAAAGEPLDRLLARRIFRPLGMGSTMFLPPLALRDRIAPTAQTAPDEWEMRGIVHDGTAFRVGGIAGHAGIFSTARDVAVFAQTVLNGGTYGTRQIFSPATVDAFRARQPRAQERALGWDTPAPESSAGSYFSAQSFGHTGFTGTSLWIDPETDLFVVLLTNRTYDRTSLLRMLDLRQRLHDAVARSITDMPVTRRPGAVDVILPPPANPAPSPAPRARGARASPAPPARRPAPPPARRPATPARSPRGRRP
jgi:serine-type D-Ala-D-Ala carboxypeptidase